VNGHLNNWIRVCSAINGFRARFGRWPKRVRLVPIAFTNLVCDVLTPVGFALVSSVVELVSEEDAWMIADDGTGAEYGDSRDGHAVGECDPFSVDWLGRAIFR
jgi:hypothetical protein